MHAPVSSTEYYYTFLDVPPTILYDSHQNDANTTAAWLLRENDMANTYLSPDEVEGLFCEQIPFSFLTEIVDRTFAIYAETPRESLRGLHR